MSRARDYSLKVPQKAPQRGLDGKFQQTPGDRLLEKHRAETRERRESEPLRESLHGKR